MARLKALIKKLEVPFEGETTPNRWINNDIKPIGTSLFAIAVLILYLVCYQNIPKTDRDNCYDNRKGPTNMDLLDLSQPVGLDQHQHFNLYDRELSHCVGLDVVASHHRHHRWRLSVDSVHRLELDAGRVLPSWVSYRKQICESPLCPSSVRSSLETSWPWPDAPGESLASCLSSLATPLAESL
jgi:hypothetical protein